MTRRRRVNGKSFAAKPRRGGPWSHIPDPSAATIKSSRRRGRLERSIAADDHIYGVDWPEAEVPPQGDVVAHARVGEPWDDTFYQMDQDPDLNGLLLRLYDAVNSLSRRVVAANETAGALEARAMVKESLSRIPQWWKSMEHMNRSAGDGNAPVELNWRNQGGVYGPYEAWPRRMRQFAWKYDSSRQLRLHVRRFDAPGGVVRADPWKFLWPCRDLLFWPWGRGLKELLFWAWKAKLITLLDWQAFNERWLDPILDLAYEAVKSTDKDADKKANEAIEDHLASVAPDITGDGFVIHSKDVDIGTVSAAMSGNDGFRSLLETLARSMARLILSEINTTGMRPGTGAYKSEEVSKDFSHQKTCLLGNDIGSYLTETLFKWLVDANLPGAPVPRLVIDTTSEAAARLVMDGVKEALAADYPVPDKHLKKAWHLPDAAEPGDTYFDPKNKPKAEAA